jgi:hypothetical protein
LRTLDVVVLTVGLASAAAMTGVIWVIQLVHYPLFDSVDRGVDDVDWIRFGERHRAAISLVVGPFMLAEGITGLWLAADPPDTVSRLLPIAGLAAMAVAYGVTAFVSVPLHTQLTTRFDAELHRRLVATNWLRTIAWTAHAALAGLMLVVAVT